MSPSLHSTLPPQPLPEALPREQAGPRQRRELRQVDPLGVPRAADAEDRDPRQLQVPLLRHPRQAILRPQRLRRLQPAAQTPGRQEEAVQGPEPAGPVCAGSGVQLLNY